MYVNDVMREIHDAFYDIPFENSTFQTEAFVIASEITPERAYRAIGLRMMSRINALQDVEFSIRQTRIDLDEIDFKLADTSLDQFERRRLQLKKEQSESGLRWTQKLCNDAVKELDVLYRHFKAMPKYTREQFENAERLHFQQRLMRQAVGLDGAKVSLINMTEDVRALEEYMNKVAALDDKNISTEALLKLSSELTNFIKETA